MILYSLFSRIKTGKNANKIVTYWEPWTIHGRVILLWWRSFSQQKQDLIKFRICINHSSDITLLRMWIYHTQEYMCEQTHVFSPMQTFTLFRKKVIIQKHIRSLQNWMHFVQVYSLKGLMFWCSKREQIYGKFLSTVMINMFKRLM